MIMDVGVPARPQTPRMLDLKLSSLPMESVDVDRGSHHNPIDVPDEPYEADMDEQDVLEAVKHENDRK